MSLFSAEVICIISRGAFDFRKFTVTVAKNTIYDLQLQYIAVSQALLTVVVVTL